jgi:5'-nucleotidase
MNWKLLLLGLALAGAAALGWMLLTPSQAKPLELTILHTNDLHAHYDSFEPWGEGLQGGVARIKTAVDSIRGTADNVLLLDAGDQFQGSLYFTVGGANIVADVMNEMGYDAMVVGNHEFDAGPATLASFIEMADFSVLGSNIDASEDSDLASEISGLSVHYMDGQAIAVFGLTSEHTAIASSPGPNVHFADAVETAQQVAANLDERGFDIIIALTHLGYERDLELARAVSGIDVIVGGHSHTWLAEYPSVVSSSSGEPVLVVTASEWGKQLGRLDIVFTRDGIVDTYAGEPIVIDETVAEDEHMLGLLTEYRSAIDDLMTTIVGATDIALNGAQEDIRVRETNLGNLICDAMLWKTKGFDTTLAIQNGGGIRASIPQGMITMGQVLEVLPYGNQITILSLSGEDVWAALENGVSQVAEGSGRFPHVGGMRYAFDPAAEPGARVTAVDVWDVATETYIPLDPAIIYQLATNNFIANGGDDFITFAEAMDRYETGWLLSDTFAEFLDIFAPVKPVIEGRITEPAPEAQ